MKMITHDENGSYHGLSIYRLFKMTLCVLKELKELVIANGFADIHIASLVIFRERFY